MGSYAGVDWAADKHDVLVADGGAVSCCRRRSLMTRWVCGRCAAGSCG